MSEGQPLSPLKHVELLRDEIRFEHTLIANRLSVLLTGQAFLMAAFAVAASGNEEHREHFLWFAYGVVPMVGLVVALLVLLAVVEGERRLGELRRRLYEDKELKGFAEKVCPQLLSCFGRCISLFYVVAMPVVFAVAWAPVAWTGIRLLRSG
jgi:hypothetical protein